MKTLYKRQWRRSNVFIVNCEHISNFVLIVDFEQAFGGLVLKIQTLLKTGLDTYTLFCGVLSTNKIY